MSRQRNFNIIKRFKRSNVKAFMLFLLFSVFIWVLVEFAKDYQEDVEFPIAFINVPKDKYITNKPTTINAIVNTTGYKLLYLKWINPSLDIDFSEAETTNDTFVYNLNENKKAIASQLKLNANAIAFFTEAITLNFEQQAVKKIKVEAINDITYGLGFSNVSALELKPDSIQITGPKTVIDSITSINTLPIVHNNLKEHVNSSIQLDTSNYKNVSFYNTEVAYSLLVDKFTEGEVYVPIKVYNVPENVQLSIFPKEVAVIFKASLSQYEDISANSFQVKQDFKKLDSNVNYFIPEITKMPEGVQQTRITNPKIQYIIKQ